MLVKHLSDATALLVPIPSGKVQLCLDLARLSEALIKPIHRDPTVNDIFQKLTHTHYVTIIDTSSGYHNLKVDKYLITLAYQFGRYGYTRLPFGSTLQVRCFRRR